MADLNEVLGKLKPAEEVDVNFDDYQDASEFPPPPPEGIYTFVAGKPEFEATKDGFLSANTTQSIVDGDPNIMANLTEGQKVVRFDRVSNKPFERNGVKVSMMTDHLRALGVFERPRSHEDYAKLIAGAEGQQFKAFLQWDGYCAHKGTSQEGTDAFSVKGQKKFDEDGTTTCPTCKQSVRARGRINRRIPATSPVTVGV